MRKFTTLLTAILVISSTSVAFSEDSELKKKAYDLVVSVWSLCASKPVMDDNICKIKMLTVYNEFAKGNSDTELPLALSKGCYDVCMDPSSLISFINETSKEFKDKDVKRPKK